MSKIVAAAVLSISILTTSFGGAFATAAYAAPAESQQSVQENASGNNNILIGLAALAVIAMISKKGSSAAGSDAAKTASKPTEAAPAQTAPSVKASSPSTATVPSTTTTTNPVSGLTADEQKALDLMNADRIANGLPTLKVNNQLVGLAERYAQDMINRGFFSHYDPEGRSPFDRMKQAGISYRSAGENLAINRNVTAAETAFMNSPGHRANILNPSYTEIGIGVKYASNGQAYVVQEFIGK